jgi:tetratricopeptide (TPR) repeat protein
MKKLMWTAIAVALGIGLSPHRLAASEPGQPTPNLKAMSVAELEKAGDASRAQKDYATAIQYFREAVSRDKKNAPLYNKLGLSELKSNDLRAARVNFEKATKLNKQYADALNNLGAVYFIQKNNGQAAKYFKKAVALDETRPTFHVNLGAAWYSQKKVEPAMKEYTRALELDPDALLANARAGITAQVQSPEERAQFYYLLAKVQVKRGDVLECLACLKKAKENGYPKLSNVYKDEEFSRLWNDTRLNEIVPPPPPR